jgi:S-adenosylmethionine hydrolase
VSLLTDFGQRDPYVGIVRGTILRAFGKAQIVDLCHEVPAQSVPLGAWFLASAIGRFPAGTVHLAVVDPGVGTARRLLAVCAHECYWIAPDNGLLSEVLAAAGDDTEVRSVDLDALGLRAESATFHGRDLFGPLAGRLAAGRFGFRALGARCEGPVRLPALVERGAEVVHVDAFGNLVTGVAAAAAGRFGEVRIGGRSAPRVQTYGDAEAGALVSLVNSFGLLEVAVVCGDAARITGAGVGDVVEIVEDVGHE